MIIDTLDLKSGFWRKVKLISDKIGTLEKDIEVKQGDSIYKAISAKKVIEEIKKAESEFNIVTSISEKKVEKFELLVSSDGKYTKFSFLINVKMIATDLDTGFQFEFNSFGHAIDYADKTPGMASTYALKYALMDFYKIPTFEEIDDSASKREDLDLTVDDKVKKIKEWIENGKTRKSTRLKSILSIYSCESIEEIEESGINEFYRSLKEKGQI